MMCIFKNVIVLLSVHAFYAYMVIEKKTLLSSLLREFRFEETKSESFLIINCDRVDIFLACFCRYLFQYIPLWINEMHEVSSFLENHQSSKVLLNPLID